MVKPELENPAKSLPEKEPSMSAPTPQALPLSTNKFAAIDPTRGFDQNEITSVTQFMAARDASTGPITEEGKRISALNARKHGFAGAQPVIDDEDKEAYSLHLDSYSQAFEPANQPEADAVRLAANAIWRIDRLTSIETALFELETEFHIPFTVAKLNELQFRHHQAIAFMQHVDSSRAIELSRRYLSNSQRDYQRAVDMFFKLKTNRIAVIPAVIQPVEDTPPPPKIHIVPRPPNELPQKPVLTPSIAPKTVATPTQTVRPSVKHTSKRRKHRK